MSRYVLLKFQPNRSIRLEVINISANPRWRPPPSWILESVHFLLLKYFNFDYVKVRSVKVAAKLLFPVRSYFFNQMALALELNYATADIYFVIIDYKATHFGCSSWLF